MITFKVKVNQHTIVQRVIKEVQELSEKLNIIVEFKYHNTLLICSPTTTEKTVFNYWKTMNQPLINSANQEQD